MTTRLEKLTASLQFVLGAKLAKIVTRIGEVTDEVNATDLLDVCATLHDHADLQFDQLMDVCGVDYSEYGDGAWQGRRYAVVYHLLSVNLNYRLRLRVFAADEEFPVVSSVVGIWSSANWFERETFDLLGIMFENHPNLRRILNDYGFFGHPLRKDFPMEGNVEMRYDPELQRVVYQPVSIELRNNVPRNIRDEGFHHG